MEIKPLDFFIGMSLGLALGVGGTMLVSRIRGWLGRSEVGRLRSENRTLHAPPGGKGPAHRQDAGRDPAPGGAAGEKDRASCRRKMTGWKKVD